MTKIQLENITKSFGAVDVIKGVDLEIHAGELMVFVGPSGCGKSTLLRLISGLEDVSDGKLLFGGEEVNTVLPSKRGISMVFQSYALYPHMSVFDNMAFGLQLAKSSKESIRERVLGAAEMLQIVELLERKPRQLSGGQRQRVAIGRAIVREPKVFLFDEPLSNLDAALRVATRLEIASLHKRMDGVTMIYVTHDQVEAMTLADRICVLKDGQVMQVGTPSDLYDAPNSLFVASFIGSPQMNFLTGKNARNHDCVTLGIRPEHIEIIDDLNTSVWSGEIIHAEELGADHFLYVDIGSGEPLVVRQPGKFSREQNSKIALAPQPGKLHRFGQDGKPIR